MKTYFANGLLKSIDNSVSKSEYTYSVRNELLSERSGDFQSPPTSTVSYIYDADGLRQQMNSPSGSPVDYTWTAKAQLAGISRDGPPPLVSYTYDKAARLTAIAHENGITEAKTYNAASELLSTLHQQGGHGYSYDTTGRRTAETFADNLTAPRTYGYDLADQVTSADYGNSLTDAYDYDPMGNRLSATRGGGLQPPSQTYVANTANQYTSITGFAPVTHDANGNLLQQNGATYTWDSENRLHSVTDGTTTNTFTYDGHHRRVTKRTAISGNVTSRVSYIYDGWNVIEEWNADLQSASSTLSKTHTWGTDLSGTLQGAGGVGALLLTEEITGTTTEAYHFQYDGNGNVTEVTDHTGATAATYRYDAFGNTLVATGPYAQENKYRFSTKPVDAEVTNTTLYYYGYRYYDPVTGRWPSRDPIGEEGGISLYGFVENDGVNKSDLLGLIWEDQSLDDVAWDPSGCESLGENWKVSNISLTKRTEIRKSRVAVRYSRIGNLITFISTAGGVITLGSTVVYVDYEVEYEIEGTILCWCTTKREGYATATQRVPTKANQTTIRTTIEFIPNGG